MSDPKEDLSAIGNAAKIFAGVTEEQVQQAAEYAQTAPPGSRRMLLGEALVATGAMDAGQRDQVMAAQRKLRTQASPAAVATVVQYVADQGASVMERLAALLDDEEEEDGP